LTPVFDSEVQLFDALRNAITSGPYPGIGSGGRAADLALVFAWRNWQLARMGGSIGAVLPRTTLSSTVGADWREEVLGRGSLHAVTAINSGQWVFASVHPQYSIVFLSLEKVASASQELLLSGPFHDFETFAKHRNEIGRLGIGSLRKASDGLAIPQLPDSTSAEIFARLIESPTLADFSSDIEFKPVYEFNATTDRPSFDAGNQTENRWPVIGGSGFEIWTPETGEIYAWADPKKAKRALQERRLRQVRIKSSAFYGQSEEWASDPETLPCNQVRIAFRDITNATNTRTCIAALIPPNVFLTNKAPYLLRIGGDERMEAFLLGVLSSIPLDWYARRFVELGMNFQILNGLPIPAQNLEDGRCKRLIENAGRLAAVDERYAAWAKAVGIKVGSVKAEDEKDSLISENDALVAHMYGLSRAQLEHIFKTFHRGWDYGPRLEKVLSFYDKLPKVAS
jgi:hypothetical protein